MSNLTYIYQKNKEEIKFLDCLNYTLEEFKANPQACYPTWDTATMIASTEKYEYPCSDVSGELREMTKYEKYQKGLYELQFNEVIYKDDVLVLEQGQYIDEKGILKTVEKIEGTRVEWNWETHEWEEKATMLEIVQAQYAEYEGMDTVSTVREMEKLDKAMADEFINMLIELRQIAYSLNGTAETQSVGYSTLPIPKPSKTLQEYLDMRKVIKIGKNN